MLAYTSLFVGGALVGLLFFALVQTGDWFRVRAYGLAVGGALGVFSLVIVLVEEPPNSVSYNITVAVLVLGQFLLWGWGLARLYAAVTPPLGLSEAPAPARPALPAERAPVGPAPSGTTPAPTGAIG